MGKTKGWDKVLASMQAPDRQMFEQWWQSLPSARVQEAARGAHWQALIAEAWAVRAALHVMDIDRRVRSESIPWNDPNHVSSDTALCRLHRLLTLWVKRVRNSGSIGTLTVTYRPSMGAEGEGRFFAKEEISLGGIDVLGTIDDILPALLGGEEDGDGSVG
jgi:hypothetical protein